MPGQILVTGADGFIGSHLVEHLVRAGRAVRALVYYNAFDTRGWLDHVAAPVRDAVEVHAGDIRDPNDVRRALRGCDAVLHLAALIGIPYSYHAADSYVDTNIRGTLNVLQAARELGVARVVQTSTSEVYGTAQSVPITEEHRLNAQSPYAATKVAADQLALAFHASFGTPVVVLRPFNTFGPRQSARAVIPTVITQIAAGSRRVRLGSLAPTRDFCYVADTVRAFAAALEREEAVGEVINVATGSEISIGGTARVIAEIMNAQVEFEADPARVRPAASEVERLCGASDKARRLLGWVPQTAGPEGFRRALGETVAWFTDPANLARYRPGSYTL
ncbi:MAG: SDR family NAD(P)-dependent oxidoreductase [Burkholderiales bacterium]|nr:SDR family NAD(P)-dependent oxidoreductase [Burkholderiales bacterium]